jgi:hypothetical protein
MMQEWIIYNVGLHSAGDLETREYVAEIIY